MAAADEDYAWPEFDEHTASTLCYTSGTTGNPKGVLYSHRSTILHTFAMNLPDAFALRAVDCLLPVVPMFHVNAWGLPYAAAMNGASSCCPAGARRREPLRADRRRARDAAARACRRSGLGLAHMEQNGRALDDEAHGRRRLGDARAQIRTWTHR